MWYRDETEEPLLKKLVLEPNLFVFVVWFKEIKILTSAAVITFKIINKRLHQEALERESKKV